MERVQTDWLDIDLSGIKTKRKTIIRGKEVDLFVSPYDIPKALRATFDEPTNTLIVELKYLNDELTEDLKYNEAFTFVLGKISHRLYGLKFNFGNTLHKDSKQNITRLDEFRSALNDLTERLESTIAKDNYEVAKDIIKAREKELLVMAA